MRHLLLAATLLLASIIPLTAQDRAAISGTILDPSGSVVENAKVKMNSPATGLHRETVTGPTGIYGFASLPVGAYTISISKDGFKPFEIQHVDLLYGQIRTVDATLQVGATSESVQVTASAESVNRSNAEIDGVIESPQIREIPLNGRNWATLMTLAPRSEERRVGKECRSRWSPYH